MNQCRTSSVEAIAANRHKKDDTCCLVTDISSAPMTAACPVSGTSSHRVQRRTLEHLICPSRLRDIRNVQYYFCTDPHCPVVYFSNEQAPHFLVQDVAVKVLAKDAGDDVNVCYCFDWTRGRIKDEIQQTGKSTASFEIAREIKAGNCACEIKNPKGECCLGDVNTYVKRVVLRHALPRKGKRYK